jgi:hypothetical protein
MQENVTPTAMHAVPALADHNLDCSSRFLLDQIADKWSVLTPRTSPHKHSPGLFLDSYPTSKQHIYIKITHTTPGRGHSESFDAGSASS